MMDLVIADVWHTELSSPVCVGVPRLRSWNRHCCSTLLFAGALAQAQSKSPGQTSVDEKIRSKRIPADKVMMKPAKIAVKVIQKTIEETPNNEESSSLSDPSSGPEDSEDRPLPGVILPNACKPQFPSLRGRAEKSGSRAPQEYDFKCMN
jgi:hypothetical protein